MNGGVSVDTAMARALASRARATLEITAGYPSSWDPCRQRSKSWKQGAGSPKLATRKITAGEPSSWDPFCAASGPNLARA